MQLTGPAHFNNLITNTMQKITIKSKANPKYADLLSRRINAWADYNKVELTDFIFREYEDKEPSIIHNRPYKYYKNLFTDERDGISLSFTLKPIEHELTSNQVLILLSELLGRIHNEAWPKEFDFPEWGTGLDIPWDTDKMDDSITHSCWHHKSIVFNRNFCKVPYYTCKIEHGNCYCS